MNTNTWHVTHIKVGCQFSITKTNIFPLHEPFCSHPLLLSISETTVAIKKIETKTSAYEITSSDSKFHDLPFPTCI